MKIYPYDRLLIHIYNSMGTIWEIEDCAVLLINPNARCITLQSRDRDPESQSIDETKADVPADEVEENASSNEVKENVPAKVCRAYFPVYRFNIKFEMFHCVN